MRTTEDWCGMGFGGRGQYTGIRSPLRWPFGFRLPVGVYDTGIGYIRVPGDQRQAVYLCSSGYNPVKLIAVRQGEPWSG